MTGNHFRTGIGFDFHRLVEGRDLILGGVEIPYAKGLLGHSDADVLVHAICDALLDNGIEIEHVCEKSCACTTCHVIVREGFNSLEASTEEEDDLLDKAWGLEPQSRLSCQARVNGADLVIEIPKYTINMVKEGH